MSAPGAAGSISRATLSPARSPRVPETNRVPPDSSGSPTDRSDFFSANGSGTSKGGNGHVGALPLKPRISGQSLLRSPDRPKGPALPTQQTSNAHVEGRWLPGGVHNASRTLFGLFRRPSSTSLATQAEPPLGSHASITDSLYGGLEGMARPGELVSPKDAKVLAGKVKTAVEAAAKYQEAMAAMSSAAAELGTALDDVSRAKGSEKVSAGLQASSGLHLLISNHTGVLAQSIGDKLVEPGHRDLKSFDKEMAQKEADFRTRLRTRIQTLRTAERTSQRQSKRRNRNLAEYRSTLLDLTTQIDDINRLKYEFLSDMYHLTGDLDVQLLKSVASVVTAEIEIFESIARKGWSGGGLDGLIAGCPDPFGIDRDQSDEEPEPGSSDVELSEGSSSRDTPNLFSVLPTGSILPSNQETSEPNVGDLTLSSQQSEGEDDEPSTNTVLHSTPNR